MVFLLVFITVLVFLAVDYFLRRERRAIKVKESSDKKPIFLSPDKALREVGRNEEKLFHLSHTWILPEDKNKILVGFDNFITSLFSEKIKVNDLPVIGLNIPQGERIWSLKLNDHVVSQLAPVSGEVIDINPALKMGIPLPTSQVERSWILKIKANNLEHEKTNLMKATQAKVMNNALRDELYIFAQKGNYLNDGGQLDPEYIEKLSPAEWGELIEKFFPHSIKK